MWCPGLSVEAHNLELRRLIGEIQRRYYVRWAGYLDGWAFMSCRFCLHWRHDYVKCNDTGICKVLPREEVTLGSHWCGKLRIKEPHYLNEMRDERNEYHRSWLLEINKRIKTEKILKLRNTQIKELKAKLASISKA